MDPEQALRISSHLFDVSDNTTSAQRSIQDENERDQPAPPQMPSTPSSVLKWALNLVSPKRSPSSVVSPVSIQEVSSPAGKLIATAEAESTDEVIVLSASQNQPRSPLANNSTPPHSSEPDVTMFSTEIQALEALGLGAPLVQADREKRKLEDDPEMAVERLHVRRLPTVEVSSTSHVDHSQEEVNEESSTQFGAQSTSIEQGAENTSQSPCKPNTPPLLVENTVNDQAQGKESGFASVEAEPHQTPVRHASTPLAAASPCTLVGSDQNSACLNPQVLEEDRATIVGGVSSTHLSPDRPPSDVIMTAASGTSDANGATNAHETRETNVEKHHDISEFDPLSIPIPKDWMIGFDSPKANISFADTPHTNGPDISARAPSPAHHHHQAFQTPKHKARAPHPYYNHHRQFNHNQGSGSAKYGMSPPPSLLDTLENDYASPGSTLKYTVREFEQMTKELEDKHDSEASELRMQLEQKTTLYEKEVREKEQIQIILDDYEKTVAKLLDDTKREKERTTLHIERLTSERERLSEQVDAMEASFKELRIRYEELKEVQEVYRRNDDTLRGTIENLKQDVIIAEQRYEKLKGHAEEKLESANTEIAKVRSDNDKEITALKAKLSRTELQVRSLESGVEAKTKENQELMAICDTLMAKMEAGR